MDSDSRIKALVEQGNAVIDPNIPIRRYFRSGMEMSKMAGIYEEENNLESAFILYFRYVDLFLDKINRHPEYANHSGVDKSTCISKSKIMLAKAESLKKTLKMKYEREFAEHVEHQKALEEIIRREKEEQELKLKKEEKRKANELLEVMKWNDEHQTPTPEKGSGDNSLQNVTFPTQYFSENRRPNSSEVEKLVTPSSQPQAFLSPSVPSRDLKPSTSGSMPNINRGSKPLSLLSANHGMKEGKLRTIMLPQELMNKFLSLAALNTANNIETCGILAGKLASNKFLITHLLIPQQVGTADSCTTQHEEELFDQQDKYDLITLGWIHTHPTQTAFLSSVDLHTHCSYQLMMPEAVAIVCAPKFNETGYFTLTPNHGLNFIANCRENGFHPHPSEPPLFQSADHILLDSSLKVQVIDLRR